jgi:hypothetical protein
MRLSLRPATMARVEAVLREFAGWLTTDAPELAVVADLRRVHIGRDVWEALARGRVDHAAVKQRPGRTGFYIAGSSINILAPSVWPGGLCCCRQRATVT